MITITSDAMFSVPVPQGITAADRPHATGPGRIGALVLAGGQGRRMGYRNKGLQPLHGHPLVWHVMEAVGTQVEYLAISANHDLPAYEALGVPVFRDEPRLEGMGPLAGILSAVPRMPANLDAVLIVPCDTPALPADLVPRLAQSLFTPGGPIAVMAATVDGPQPSIVLLRPEALSTLAARMQAGEGDLSLRGWLKSCDCSQVLFGNHADFANINDQAALSTLQSGSSIG